MTGFLMGHATIVTGGRPSIGAATAVALAEVGVTHLALVARSAEQLQVTAEPVRQAGAAATVSRRSIRPLRRCPNSRRISPRWLVTLTSSSTMPPPSRRSALSAGSSRRVPHCADAECCSTSGPECALLLACANTAGVDRQCLDWHRHASRDHDRWQ